jgi:hypothetical protein
MMLHGTKIVVIDDKLDEVKNLLGILNKNGLAFTYYKGDEHAQLPDKPLSGVRLLFLDFVLGTDGQSDRNKIAVLMNVMKTTIARGNGPYIILAWTKHDTPQDNLLALFKEEIMKSTDVLRPMAIINMEKRDSMESLSRISRNIRRNLNDNEILEILMHWENHAANASNEVLRTLSDISRPQPTQGETFDQFASTWNSQLERHIYRIAESFLGQNIKPDRQLLIAAQLSFTELFRDHIETIIRKGTKPFKKLTEKIGTHKNENYTPDEKAYMNTSFLLISKDLDETLQPGNIYRLEKISEKLKCEKKDCYINKTKLTTRAVVSEFFSGKLVSYANKKELIKKAIPILMEITPECDYAQNKWRHAKLVMGVLWPESAGGEDSLDRKINKKAGFIYDPLTMKYKGEVYHLTFNANHMFNIGFSVFASVSPIMKARKELLVDIQHWFSRHLSRPGKTEF